MSDNNYEYAIYSLLSSDTQLAAIVGNNIFPSIGFQGAPYPCITYEIYNDSQINNLTAADNLTWIYYRFTLYCETADQRRQISERLRNLLNGRLNKALTYTGGSAILSSSWMLPGSRDFYHSPPDASETGVFERKLSFRMCFQQTIPTL